MRLADIIGQKARCPLSKPRIILVLCAFVLAGIAVVTLLVLDASGTAPGDESTPVPETITISRARRSGDYALPPDKPLRLKQLIAVAGGPEATGRPVQIEIVRLGDGAGNTVRSSLEGIMTGAEEDTVLRKGDKVHLRSADSGNQGDE